MGYEGELAGYPEWNLGDEKEYDEFQYWSHDEWEGFDDAKKDQ